MKWKNGVKVVVIIVAVAFIMNYLLGVLNWKNATDNGIDIVEHFYETDEHTMDVIFYGSSHCFCTINNAILWDEAKIASYNFTAGCQNIGNTYYYMKESLKTQSPKVMVVEMYYVTNNGYGTQGDVYRNTLGLNWSLDYIKNAKYTAGKSAYNDTTTELTLKLPIIHSRYQELTSLDFVDKKYYNRGFRSSWLSNEFVTPEACVNDEIGVLSEENKYWIRQMKELAAENNIDLVLFTAPYILSPEAGFTYNALAEFCKEENIEYLDFNKRYLEIGFNYASDMWEKSHVNVYGSEKVTKYICDYLTERYTFESHASDERYEIWETNSLAWQHEKDNYRMKNINNLQEYILNMPTDGYIYFIGQQDDFIEGGRFQAVENGNHIEEKGMVDVSKETTIAFDENMVNIGGQEYPLGNASVTILLYDELLDELVDVVYCGDIASGELFR